jgi:hypothetical protein
MIHCPSSAVDEAAVSGERRAGSVLVRSASVTLSGGWGVRVQPEEKKKKATRADAHLGWNVVTALSLVTGWS